MLCLKLISPTPALPQQVRAEPRERRCAAEQIPTVYTLGFHGEGGNPQVFGFVRMLLAMGSKISSLLNR